MCESGRVAVLNQTEQPRLSAVSRLRVGRPRTVVVVAAHLDEELCAAGGLLASLAAAGVDIRVLAVTDGDGTAPGERDRAANARLRRRHATLATAYQLLGLDFTRRYRLGLGCGAVAAAEGDVVAAISELLGFADPRGLLCLAPWTGDSHPDHAAVGRAATSTCRAYHTRLLSYSIPQADQAIDEQSPTGVPGTRRFAVPEGVGSRKDQALIHLTRPHHPARPDGDRGQLPAPAMHACELFISTS
jgi:LmbE family N-acetylglucosaminyl deacetylase